MAKNGTVGIGYSRRSLVYGRADASSVERQDEVLEATIRADGLSPRLFSDASGHRSGRNATNRPEYRNAIALIPHPDTKCIYFDLLDRAWRNVEEWNRMMRLCREHDVNIKLVSQYITIDSDLDPFRKFMLDNLASAAEFESNVASYRQKKEVANKKSKGVYWGGTPFGSKRVGLGQDACMVRHVQTLPDGRAIDHGASVNRLMELYATSMSFASIAAQLNKEGYQHLDRKNNLVPFGIGAIQSIAWNVLFYAGYLVVDRKWKSKNSKIALVGDGDWVERYARAMGAVRSPKIEPILSAELANRVVESRFTRRRTGYTIGKRHTALLTPIAYHNNQKLRAQGRDAYYVYRTRGPNSIQFRGNSIDDELVEHLSNLVFPEPLRLELKRMRAEENQDEEMARRVEQVEKLRRKTERQKELYTDGIMAREEFDRAYAATLAELAQAERMLNTPDALDGLIANLTSLEVLHRIPVTRRKAAIQHLFERVDIGEGGKIEKLYAKPWAARAFGILLSSLKSMYQQYPRQDLNPDSEHLFWLANKTEIDTDKRQ